MRRNKKYKLTEKEKAYCLAFKYGLCPKIDGGYDTTNFDKFWEEFVPHNYETYAELEKTAEQTHIVAVVASSAYFGSLIAQIMLAIFR